METISVIRILDDIKRFFSRRCPPNNNCHQKIWEIDMGFLLLSLLTFYVLFLGLFYALRWKTWRRRLSWLASTPGWNNSAWRVRVEGLRSARSIVTIAIYPMPTDINNKFLFSCKRFIPASNKTVHNFLAFLCGLGAKNEEQESKTARKMAQVKERGGVGSRFISRAVKTENPFPRSIFAPKPNGNACYAG